MRKMLILAFSLSLPVSSLAANPALRDLQPLENGLLEISVADKIRRECGTISARLVRAHRKMQSLYDYAKSQGYTDTEIRSYVDADVEKTRMRSKRDAYLAKVGVVKSNPESYCAAGRAEIENSSQIGALLRAR